MARENADKISSILKINFCDNSGSILKIFNNLFNFESIWLIFKALKFVSVQLVKLNMVPTFLKYLIQLVDNTKFSIISDCSASENRKTRSSRSHEDLFGSSSCARKSSWNSSDSSSSFQGSNPNNCCFECETRNCDWSKFSNSNTWYVY